MNSILKNTAQNDDEASIRPLDLSDFTGQSEQIKNLSIFIRAAKRRGEPLDHILFYGPPGLGKTTLSRIIANELGVDLKSIAAPAIAKPGDLVAVLVALNKNDVLFIDEIHRLPLIVEEVLYGAMEDRKITILVGSEQNAEPIEIPVNAFTLVGATTRKGMLSQPLNDRFGIQFRMDFYPPEDLVKIVKRASRILGVKISDDASLCVAQRSRGTPRIALRLLRRIRDFMEDAEVDTGTAEFVSECLDVLGVSPDGLDELDRRYLECLKKTFRGGPVGIETLASSLSESRETLESSVEPYLLRTGLIVRTPRGRSIPREDEKEQLKLI